MKIIGILRYVFLFIFILSVESFGKQTDPQYASLYNRFCSNENFVKTLDNKNDNRKKSILFRGLILAQTPDGQRAQLEKSKGDLNLLTEEEKILVANILMMARSTDFDKIRSLLKFSSKDPIVESYRMFFLGVLNANLGDNLESYKLMESAMEKLPFIDENMLLSTLSVAGRLENRSQNFGKYLNQIDSLPSSSALKYLLLATREMLGDGWSKKSHEITQLVKKAYNICPNDPLVLFVNAAVEESNGDINYARDLYLSIVEKQFLYYPDIDARLFRIFFEKQNNVQAKLFLENAKNGWQYLSPSERDVILASEKIMNYKTQHKKMIQKCISLVADY